MKNLALPALSLILILSQNVLSSQHQADQPGLKTKIQQDIEVDAIYLSDEGNYFVTSGAFDDVIVLWNTRSLRQIRSFNCLYTLRSQTDIQLEEKSGRLACLCGGEYSYERQVLVYDINDGQLIQSTQTNSSIKGFSLSTNTFFTSIRDNTNSTGITNWYSLENDSLLGSLPFYSFEIGHYPETHLVVCKSAIDQIEAVDILADSLDHRSTIMTNKAGAVNTFQISSDNNKILVTYRHPPGEPALGFYLPWEIFSISSGELLIKGKEQPCSNVQFHPSGQSIISISSSDEINPHGFGNMEAVYQHSLNTGENTPVFQFHSSSLSNMTCHRSSPRLLLKSDNEIQLINTSNFNVESLTPEGMKDLNLDVWGNGNSEIIISAANSVHVVDLSNPLNYGHFVHEKINEYIGIVPAGGSTWIIESIEESRVHGKNFTNHYKMFDSSGNLLFRFDLANRSIDKAKVLSAKNQLLAITYDRNVNFSLEVLDLASGKCLSSVNLDSKSLDLLREDLQISSDNRFVFLPKYDAKRNGKSSYSNDIYVLDEKLKKYSNISGAIHIWDLPDDLLLVQSISENGFECEFQVIDMRSQDLVRTVASGFVKNCSAVPSSTKGELFVMESNVIHKISIETGQSILKAKIDNQNIEPINIIGDFLVINNSENVKWWAVESLEESFITICDNDAGVFAQVPSKSYMTFGDRNLQYVSFVSGRNAYSYDQFDVIYNRPDIVLSAMGQASQELRELYKKAFEHRIHRRGLTQNKGQLSMAPIIEIDRAGIPLIVDKNHLSINVAASCTGSKLNSIHVWVNGTPIYGVEGMRLDSVKSQYSNLHEIPLASGSNVIEIAATNSEGVQSLRESFGIEYQNDTPGNRTIFIGVGVGEYADSSKNLQYPVKDIRDLEVSLKSKYPNLNSHLLLDEKSTRNEILSLKEVLSKTEADDLVLLSFSGHGLLSASEFFFATHGTNFDNPELEGLSYHDIEWLLDSIPAQSKIVTIDACNSGEIGKSNLDSSESPLDLADNVHVSDASVNAKGIKRLNSEDIDANDLAFELMQQTFSDVIRGNGAVVIAATSGMELAFESDEWSNGVFTFCLLKGLEEGLADLNNDQVISASEIRNYVQTEVEKLTNGIQRPTSRQANLVHDFKIW